MIDSSSWTLPESESGGCQLGILEDFFQGAKTKWPLNNRFWAMYSLVNHLKHYFGIYPHVSRVKESDNDEIKDVCMTRFKMAAI